MGQPLFIGIFFWNSYFMQLNDVGKTSVENNILPSLQLLWLCVPELTTKFRTIQRPGTL
jgi:hypothetical protein